MKIKKYGLLFTCTFCLCYLTGSVYYHNRFLPNTYLNGINITNLDKIEAFNKIKNKIESYEIELLLRGNKKEKIKGTDMDFNIYVHTNELLVQQDNFAWPISIFKKTTLVSDPVIDFDNNLLESKIKLFNCVLNGIAPADAYISEYIENIGYEIVVENNGSLIDSEILIQKLQKKIGHMEPVLDLDKEGCYKKVKINSTNPELNSKVSQLNSYLAACITYVFGEVQIILNSDIYHQWIVELENGYAINEELATEYVNQLAMETDTAYTIRNFKTANNAIVQVEGPFGYQINKTAEVEQLISEIESGIKTDREPLYKQTGMTRDGEDYGNTYVEIDLTNQKVYFYAEGNLIDSSSCVTGNVSKEQTTPPGIFPLTYKQKDTVLRGPGYASPVKFWMPFNGGIGLHDASWRSAFGGEIYKTDGSHGCVNLPYNMAKTLYDNIYQGIPVICYN